MFSRELRQRVRMGALLAFNLTVHRVERAVRFPQRHVAALLGVELRLLRAVAVPLPLDGVDGRHERQDARQREQECPHAGHSVIGPQAAYRRWWRIRIAAG